MILYSLVKFINTHTPMHAHAQMNKKSLLGQTVVNSVTYRASYIQETTTNLLRSGLSSYIHILNISYTTTHSNMQL